jgi:glycine/D-amino acid oxidase-like deaminating enzyme
VHTDVVVIGAGISGALAAYSLVKAGYKVVVLSKHHTGTDSTCASTALLQYEIDTPLFELIKKVGKQDAERSYLLCHESINQLERIHKEVGAEEVFERRKSILLASYKKDVADLELEYKARKAIGINVKWMEEKQVKMRMGFSSPAAILSAQAATTNAYFLTQKLIHACVKLGAEMYDGTEVESVTNNARWVTVKTTLGNTLTCKYCVMATGYEATKWLNINVAQLHSTYAMISKPFAKNKLWPGQELIWETATPYLYMRTTPDNRVIIGGKDDTFASAKKRDALLGTKVKQLLKSFNQKFPKLEFDIDYAWAGTFAETKDGLPYIGATKQKPRILYALGYGGNGITFSQIAADVICNIISGKDDANARIFSFYRKDAD